MGKYVFIGWSLWIIEMKLYIFDFIFISNQKEDTFFAVMILIFFLLFMATSIYGSTKIKDEL